MFTKVQRQHVDVNNRGAEASIHHSAYEPSIHATSVYRALVKIASFLGFTAVNRMDESMWCVIYTQLYLSYDYTCRIPSCTYPEKPFASIQESSLQTLQTGTCHHLPPSEEQLRRATMSRKKNHSCASRRLLVVFLNQGCPSRKSLAILYPCGKYLARSSWQSRDGRYQKKTLRLGAPDLESFACQASLEDRQPAADLLFSFGPTRFC